MGTGLVLGIPTESGDDLDGAPFVSGNLPVGEWSLRSSFGYVIKNDFFYEAACLRPVGDWGDFRTEFTGGFNDSFNGHHFELLPGFDFHFAHDAGVALAGAATKELAVDAARLVARGGEDEEAAGGEGVGVEADVRATPGHAGGDGDGAGLSGFGDHGGFLGVADGVEDAVGELCLREE